VLSAAGLLCVLAAKGHGAAGGIAGAPGRESVALDATNNLLPQLQSLRGSGVLADWEALDAWKAIAEIVDAIRDKLDLPNLPWATRWARLRPELSAWAGRHDTKQLRAEAEANLARLKGQSDPTPTLPRLAVKIHHAPAAAVSEAGGIQWTQADTLTNLAKKMGIHRNTLKNRIDDGTVPYRRLGRLYRIDVAQISSPPAAQRGPTD